MYPERPYDDSSPEALSDQIVAVSVTLNALREKIAELQRQHDELLSAKMELVHLFHLAEGNPAALLTRLKPAVVYGPDGEPMTLTEPGTPHLRVVN